MVSGILINTDGTVQDVTSNEGEDTLRFMYRVLNVQMVELVSLTDTLDLWIDEEGMYSGQEPNEPATRFAARHGFRNPWGIPLMGPVLILGGTDEEGDTRSLAAEDAEKVRNTLEYAR